MDAHTVERLAATEKIHSIVIKDFVYEELFNVLEETILVTEYNRIQGLEPSETNNICLIGETGAGKTKISSRVLQQFPVQEIVKDSFRITKIPTFYASNTGRSVNGLASVMLTKLGDPEVNPKADLNQLTNKLSQQLISAETNLIMLDEFHEILKRKDSSVVISWVKSLANATRTPIMIMGTPKLKGLIESDEEIKRRFRIIQLEKLTFTVFEPDCSFNSFSAALAAKYQEVLSLKSFPKFDNLADLIRLNLATNGYPGNISELFKSATKLAIRQGLTEVTLHHFRDVYKYEKCTNLEIKNINPFTINEDQLISVFNDKKMARKSS